MKDFCYHWKKGEKPKIILNSNVWPKKKKCSSEKLLKRFSCASIFLRLFFSFDSYFQKTESTDRKKIQQLNCSPKPIECWLFTQKKNCLYFGVHISISKRTKEKRVYPHADQLKIDIHLKVECMWMTNQLNEMDNLSLPRQND